MPVARLGLVLNLLVPLTILIWDAGHGKLGADPVNYATLTTGLCAVTFLLLSLGVTPVRMISGWTWLTQFRRSLGVYAFYYGCAHLFIYFWWDRTRSLDSTVYEITHRYYLTIGFASLVLMAPLWVTSFNAAIQAMGATQWKRLHRLTYVAVGLERCGAGAASKSEGIFDIRQSWASVSAYGSMTPSRWCAARRSTSSPFASRSQSIVKSCCRRRR
jgi:DMSO/TMAO reductase YedYZ heme-binding membrane subunit